MSLLSQRQFQVFPQRKADESFEEKSGYCVKRRGNMCQEGEPVPSGDKLLAQIKLYILLCLYTSVLSPRSHSICMQKIHKLILNICVGIY